MSFVQRSRAATTRLVKYKVPVYSDPFGASFLKQYKGLYNSINQRGNIKHSKHYVQVKGSIEGET